MPLNDVVMATWSAEASKVVIVLSYWSFAVSVFVPLKATPSVWEPPAAKTRWSSAAAVTVTDGEPAVSVVSVPLDVDFSCTVQVAAPEVVGAPPPGPPPDLSP